MQEDFGTRSATLVNSLGHAAIYPARWRVRDEKQGLRGHTHLSKLGTRRWLQVGGAQRYLKRTRISTFDVAGRAQREEEMVCRQH